MTEKSTPYDHEEKINKNREELIAWFNSEISWWMSVYKKDPSEVEQQAILILDELCASGYTPDDGLRAMVREKLRRHRWDLELHLFYPDSQLTTSEITAAIQRAYQRGMRQAHKQPLPQFAPLDKPIISEAMNIVKLQSKLFDAEQKIEQQQKKIEYLESRIKRNQPTNDDERI